MPCRIDVNMKSVEVLRRSHGVPTLASLIVLSDSGVPFTDANALTQKLKAACGIEIVDTYYYRCVSRMRDTVDMIETVSLFRSEDSIPFVYVVQDAGLLVNNGLWVHQRHNVDTDLIIDATGYIYPAMDVFDLTNPGDVAKLLRHDDSGVAGGNARKSLLGAMKLK